MARAREYDDWAAIKTTAQKKKEAREAAIQADIQKITDILATPTERGLLEVHQYIDGKYQACIAGWNQSVYGYVPGYGFNYDVIGEESLVHNLQMMKPKLEAFVEGWNVISVPTTTATAIPEINVNTTTNVNITITFEQVRSKLEEMTSLTDEQTKEALEKVSEIEEVVKGEGSKKSKWEKIKPILTWLADKSFDVAMTILPLLLQVQG